MPRRKVSKFRALVKTIKKAQLEREFINREAQQEKDLFDKEVILAVKIKIREERDIKMHENLIGFLSKTLKENNIGIRAEDIEVRDEDISRKFPDEVLKKAQDLLDAVQEKRRQYLKEMAMKAPASDAVAKILNPLTGPKALGDAVVGFASSTKFGNLLTGYGSAITGKTSPLILEAAQQEMQKYAAGQSSASQQSSSSDKTSEAGAGAVKTDAKVLDPEIFTSRAGSLRRSYSATSTLLSDFDTEAKEDLLTPAGKKFEIVDHEEEFSIKHKGDVIKFDVESLGSKSPSWAENALEAANWLSRVTGHIIKATVFLTAATNPRIKPEMRRAAIFYATTAEATSLLPTSEAVVKVAEKDYETTFCFGLDLLQNLEAIDDKKYLKSVESAVEFTSCDEAVLSSKKLKPKRIIINAHGAIGLIYPISSKILGKEDDGFWPSVFVKRYFSEAKIIHILSCQSGGDKYKRNKLGRGQIMFFYNDGGDEFGYSDYKISLKLTMPNTPEEFKIPSSSPIKMLYVGNDGIQKFVEIKELSTQNINDSMKSESGLYAYFFQPKVSALDKVYNLIVEHTALQRQAALTQLEGSGFENIVALELDKLCFIDDRSKARTQEYKENFVRQYLLEMLVYEMEIPKKIPDIKILLKSELFTTLFPDSDLEYGDLKLRDIAAKSGNIELIRLFGINAVTPDQDLSAPLAIAVADQNLDLVNELLEAGANPNALIARAGNSPLICLAIQMGNYNIVESLLDKGANPNVLSHDGSTPLDYALVSKNNMIIDLLLSKKANPNFYREDTDPPLVTANRNGNIQAVTSLLNNGANPNIIYQDATVMCAAASMGHYEIIKLLLAKKADPTPLCKGWTAIKFVMNRVSDKGSFETAKLLAENGADVKSIIPFARSKGWDQGQLADLEAIHDNFRTPKPSSSTDVKKKKDKKPKSVVRTTSATKTKSAEHDLDGL